MPTSLSTVWNGPWITGERIAIWGDYDADGMTAVVVWSIALRALGAEAIRHVPVRLAEGYGLSNAGLERLAAAGVYAGRDLRLRRGERRRGRARAQRSAWT